MRNITELNKNWLYVAKETEDGKAFSDTITNLPFFHSADTMQEGTFSTKWIPSEADDGKTVYLEFSQISGEAEIYCGDTLLGTHTGSVCSFRQLLALEVHMGEEYEIKVKVIPKARPDGMFVFAGVSLITVDSSHFNMLSLGKGIFVDYELKENEAVIKIETEIVRPNNYDVVSYTVTDMKGDTVFTKTCKPTSPCTEFSLTVPELWDGQSGAYIYTLNAKLLRDSQCLDEINTDFGLRNIALNSDGFLYLNGFRLPLNGVSLTDCSAVKSDSVHLKELDGNILLSSLLPSKTNLLSLCDKEGLLFWYSLEPSGNTENDMAQLKEFLLLYRNHPSLAAVVSEGDDDYFRNLLSVLKEYAPKVQAVIKRNIETACENIPEAASIVMLSIPYKTEPDAFITISGRFSELQEKYPEKFFAIFPENPLKTDITLEEHNEWHIRLWNAFYRQKNVIAFFGGLLTDGKSVNSKRGLISSDRAAISDAFWFYRSQFSSKGFIKICEPTQDETDEKFIDIKCITNCTNLRILINGRDKNHKAEKITDGVYVFRQIKLKRDVNLIEVSAGDECDSAEIIRY
ncbi:MAG: hypothetical protein IKL10_03980 [Clostridia bacterium]|nr:hypothetical protein [Clostridia bacterium]